MEIHLENEYKKAVYCLMVYPCKFYVPNKNDPSEEAVNMSLMFKQYNDVVNLMIRQGVQVQFLDIMNSTEQVYSRDIGFVVKDILFVSKPKSSERVGEIDPLMKLIKKYNIKHYVMQNNIEGGDIVIRDEELFIGVSDRTTLEAIEEVQKVLDDNSLNVKTIPINFDRSKIHLDCAFNVLDRDDCVITDYVYDVDIISKYIKNCIKISKAAADELGTNYFYLGERKLISSSQEVVNLLKGIGYEAYYTDFSEIIKGSGSIGCCILPILRV